MDKIDFFVHCTDCALQKFSSMLDDDCLFGSSRSSDLKYCDAEVNEVFRETKESNSDEREEYYIISCLYTINCYCFFIYGQ